MGFLCEMAPSRRKRMRAELVDRDGLFCHYCLAELTTSFSPPFYNQRRDPFYYRMDHVIPRALGGPDEVWNLVLTCAPCNSKKGSDPYEKFAKTDLPKWVTDVLAIETTYDWVVARFSC